MDEPDAVLGTCKKGYCGLIEALVQYSHNGLHDLLRLYSAPKFTEMEMTCTSQPSTKSCAPFYCCQQRHRDWYTNVRWLDRIQLV
jgi:hypothetical protein